MLQLTLYHLIHLGLEVLKVEWGQKAQGSKVEGHNRRHTALWVRRPGGIAGLPRNHQTVNSCTSWGWVSMSQARGRRARAGQGRPSPKAMRNRRGGPKRNKGNRTRPVHWSHSKDLASTRYKAMTVATMPVRLEGRLGRDLGDGRGKLEMV